MSPFPRMRIGISACLLGQKVRFDGGHKEDSFITRTLGNYFEWVPVCPEVELGLGAPRDSMRLEQIEGSTRLIVPRTGKDLTEDMRLFSRRRVKLLARVDLSGFILKSKSPSCGMERIRIYRARGIPARSRQGLFAAILLECLPNLPVEEESRLCDPRIRDNWIERVFAYWRLRMLWRSRWTVRRLSEFHTENGLALLSHAPRAYRQMGSLLARAGELSRDEVRERYEAAFMRALKPIATRGRHVRVLRHLAGYLDRRLDSESLLELHACIRDYQNRIVPLLVPLTLLKHHVRRLEIPSLAGQTYLNPHPDEIALRYHA